MPSAAFARRKTAITASTARGRAPPARTARDPERRRPGDAAGEEPGIRHGDERHAHGRVDERPSRTQPGARKRGRAARGSRRRSRPSGARPPVAGLVWRKSETAAAVTERARQRPDDRVRADLVHAKVSVPAERHERRVEIRGERPQYCRGHAAARSGPSSAGRGNGADERAAERRVRHRIHRVRRQHGVRRARRSRRAARPSICRSGTRTRDAREPERRARRPPAAPRPESPRRAEYRRRHKWACRAGP